MQTLVFHVRHPGEPAAGIRSFAEEVTIFARNDFGGEPAEVAEHFRVSIAEWFDGARVQTDTEWRKEQALIDRQRELD